MRGCLVDVWKYTWLELWEPLEQLPDFSGDIYMPLYVELEKALKFRMKTSDDKIAASTYIETANDTDLARQFLMELESNNLAGDGELVIFFKNAYDVFSESDSEEISSEFIRLLTEFLNSRNLRYELHSSPFQLQPHIPGVFASVFNEISKTALNDKHLSVLMKDFEHSFYTVSRTHLETDMKTCISKACMFIEGIGALHPQKGTAPSLGAMCDKITCWPHAKLQEAVKSMYHFCCDYPGIRHAGNGNSQIRPLELHDSIIVPLMLLIASGYFLTWSNISEVIGINIEDK
jgi:hypothetical protein